MMTPLTPLKPSKKRISSADILNGKNIPKIDRLRGINEDDFEDLVLEWAHDFLDPKYNGKVKQFGGGRDKGRDVIGYYANKDIDIYQCKYYSTGIAPGDMWVEFGKLCYYTFNGDYPIPNNYVIVSPYGVGGTLNDFIDQPLNLKKELILKWKKNCETKITTTKSIVLSGKFEQYVRKFDFSIISSKEPLELIEEHSKTKYHAMRFGGGLTKGREIIPKANKQILKKELKYVTQLYNVYSEESKISIKNKTELKKADLSLFEHFNNQRDCFYSAESLERFSRDNFPDSEPLPFDEIKLEIYSILTNNLMFYRSETGLKRLSSSLIEAQRASFSSNPLSIEIKAEDKSGICHYLANDDKVKWII